MALDVTFDLDRLRVPTAPAVLRPPASATPAPVTSDDSQALLERFKHFQGSQNPEQAASGPASAGQAKEGPEKSQALLEKFMQWQQRK